MERARAERGSKKKKKRAGKTSFRRKRRKLRDGQEKKELLCLCSL
jgi:hypothetical protein